jgi:hypothetical protein
MTLRGSLSDLNVVELVQVPAAGRKTGELIIASPETDARLYFVDGNLVHLAMDELIGQDVLVDLLGWREGEFEFRQNMLTDERSFDGDLHRAIMAALKERDERDNVEPPADDGEHEAAARLLADTLSTHEFVLHASMISFGGRVLARANAGDRDPEGVDELRRSICALAMAYPRQALQRILLEDELGTVAACCFESDTALMVAADRTARVGAVSMVLERLARALREARGVR